MTLCTVYCLTSKVTGMKYVGITKRLLAKRVNAHKNSVDMRRFTKHPLYMAIKSDGFKSFDVTVLAETMCIEKAGMFEVRFIKDLNCRAPHGYNVREGGVRGFAEGPRSEEFKASCKERAKKQFADPANRERVRLQQNKFWNDPIRSRQARERIASRMNTPEAREASMRGLAKAWKTPYRTKGWKLSAVTREKMSQRMLKRYSSPDARKEASVISIANWTPELRAKAALKRKQMWADPQYKQMMLSRSMSETVLQKRGENMRAKWADPEYREMMRKAHTKTVENANV